MNSPRIKLLAAGFVLVLAVIAAVLVFFISSAVRPAPDAKNIAVQPPVGAAPPTPPVSASAGNAVPAPRVVAHPKAPADAAWNPVASRKGNTLLTAGHTEELLNSPAPKPGDPLPAHLNKIWPKATYIARHDKRAPLGTERVSIIQPASLPYPVRIQEFFPDNSEPVIASEMIADRILVGKPKTMTHENFQRALSLAGARGIQRLTQSGVYQILLAADYTDPDTIPQSIAHYRANFPVAYSEPDFVQRASLVANDPAFADGTLWGLHNTGQNSGTADADIDAPEAWDVRSGSPSIVVAVVDTGVRYTHEDIAANMWVNPGEIPGNGIDDDNNGYIDDVHGINAILNNGNPMDDNKHGSHCAGTIAGVGNNGKGVAGVSWSAKIMATKFLSAEGSGSLSDAIKCIEYARINGARLTSNSWGGGSYAESLRDAIRATADAGMLFIAAAGNETNDNNTNPTYPCTYDVPNIVSVAATDRNDAIAYFSNYGIGTVDLGAPGVDIYSLTQVSDSSYASLSGTSMACPHAAGAAALLWAQFPGDTAGQILNRLLSGAEPTSAMAERTLSGSRLNLHRALTLTNGRPFNDNFANARAINRESFALRQTVASPSAEPSNLSDGIANGPAVWFRFTALAPGEVVVSTGGSSYDTLLGIYTGAGLDNLVTVTTNDDQSETVTDSRATFTVSQGVTYHIAVVGKAGAQGLLRLEMVGPVTNDNLADAEDMGDFWIGLGKHNRTATKEPGEANHAGNTGGRSVWGKFTPTLSGYYGLTTGGESGTEWSTFNTLLAVYAGPSANPTHPGLTLVAQNDDDPTGYFNTSIVGFYVSAGQTYYVAIDGKWAASGDIRAFGDRIGAHDYFANALPLNGDTHSLNTNNRVATTEPGEPDHAGNKPRATLWFNFTPETSGSFEVDNVPTGGLMQQSPTFMAVYQGDSLGNLTEVASATHSGYDWSTYLNFNAVAGQSYKIVTGVAYDNPTTILGPTGLRIRKAEPLLNDHFANAISIPTFTGWNFSSVTGHNRGANLEPGEPTDVVDGFPSQATVWWKWTADQSGLMQANTNGSSLYTNLWVYTGNAVNSLTEVAFDDVSGESFRSLATFTAVSGTTYYFRVSGYANQVGNLILNLGRHRVPGDNFADPFVVEPNLFFQPYTNAAATLETGEPRHGFSPIEPGNTSNQKLSLWFRFTATSETAGPVVFSTQGSQNTVASVYTGSAVNALTLVAANNDVATDRTAASVRWTAVAGTTYHIAVAFPFAQDTGGGAPYIITFQRLTNDGFANAIPFAGDTQSVTSHNFLATKESGEPSHAANSGGRSVWFNWTPATSGTFRLSTRSSTTRIYQFNWAANDTISDAKQMDTLLGVYTGSAVNALTAVASNNDYGFPNRSGQYRTGITSELFLDATAGTTYRIAVDGMNDGNNGMTGGDMGQIRLEIAKQNRPAADNFASAEIIASTQLPYLRTTDLSNIGATTEAGEPTHAGNAARSKNTLWFRFTAPESRTYFASTAGNLYDDARARNTVVAVYTGSAVGSLSQIAANSGGLGLGHSIAQFNAVAGTTYHIAVGSEHAGALSFILVPRPANDDLASATQAWGSNFTAIGYNVGASGETGEADPYGFLYSGGSRLGTRRSVWWKWTPPVSGVYSIETYGSDLWTHLSIHTGASALSSWLWRDVSDLDPLNYLVTGKKDELDRRRRGTRTTSYEFNAGVTYYFRVGGGDYNGDHAGTIRLDVSGPPAPPPAPLALAASRASAAFVLLSWQDLSNDETAYVLERSLDGSAWSPLATLAANTVSYLDTTAPEADLHYRIRATNTLGVSAWTSAFVVLPAPPPAPQNFAGAGTSMTSTSLTWTAPADATTLRLERSATGSLGPWTVLNAALPGNATTYADTGLQANKTYWYRLRATNTIGTGTWSAVASVTTLNAATLVSDSFSDGGVTDGTDPLDVAWKKEGVAQGVTADTGLDPTSPNNVMRLESGTDTDIYAYFTLPGGNQTLAVGESLKLSFKLRHTGTPRADNSRTGFSLAYTPTNNPWPGAGNREYMVRTSYGSAGNHTAIVRTADVQLINSSGTDVFLANTQPAINAGTSATSAWMEVHRTGESTVIVRAQIGSNPVIETADTGTANGANSGIVTTFNRVFFRFRTTAGTTEPKFHLDDVTVTKTLSGTPAPSQHPITVWRQTYFSTTANSGLAADLADADGDGIANLVEYALGSRPDTAGDHAKPTVDTTTVSGQPRLTLDFTPAQNAGLRFVVEASNDLTDWSDQTDLTDQLTAGQPFTFIDSANLATTQRRFLRLRVVVEP